MLVESIIRGFLSFAQGTINLVFGPLFALINPILENLGITTPLTIFNNIMTTYVMPSVGFFCEFIPPKTLEVICMELVITIAFWTIMFTIHETSKVLRLVKKVIPFF